MSILKANRIENLTTTDGGINVNNSGQVGVGTSSPGANLEVRGSSSNGQIRIGGSTSGTYSQIYSDNDGVLILNADQGNNAASSYLGLNVDNSERLRIDSSGNVGIGTSSPGAGLDVVGNSTMLRLYDGTNTSTGKISQSSNVITLSQAGTSSGALAFATGSGALGTERMRIDGSGNVGIGTTSLVSKFTIDNGGRADPSSTGSTTQSNAALEINADSESNTRLMAGMSTGSKFWMQVQNTSGNTADDILLNPIGGRVGIGTTSPLARTHLDGTDNDVDNVLFLTAANLANGAGGRISFGGNYDGTNRTSWADIKGSKENATSGQYGGYLSLSTRPNGGSNTERMRIDSGGNFAFGTSSTTRTQANRSMVFTVGTNGDISVNHSTSNASGDFYLVFGYNGSQIGSITQNGTTAVAYNTTSDYRLKENVVDLDGAITRVKQLAPKRFNFIADDSRIVDGFLAHEAQVVVPEAVTGTHDEVDDDGNAVMQGIDHSKLVPLLTAALQEAIGKIETLETQNTAQQTQIDDLLSRVTALETAS